MEKDRDCPDLDICFMQEPEGMRYEYLNGGAIVNSPQSGERIAVR